MKKQSIIVAILLSLCSAAWAQKEYRINKSSGKLHVNLAGAIIEGYDGKEIIFSSQQTTEEDDDERARGLQALTSSGYRDNTGFGINVTENGQDVEVNPVGNRSVLGGDVVRIRVPSKMSVVFNNDRSMFSDTLHIKGIKGELEVSTSYNEVILENNTGPMNVKAVYQNVEASFAKDITGPISIISVYGHVDVAMPKTTKANIALGTDYGKLYAADDFNIAIKPQAQKSERGSATGAAERPTVNGLEAPAKPAPPDAPNSVTVTGEEGLAVAVAAITARAVEVSTLVGELSGWGITSENIEGTVNGGGTNFILKSTYKNVYLRTN